VCVCVCVCVCREREREPEHLLHQEVVRCIAEIMTIVKDTLLRVGLKKPEARLELRGGKNVESKAKY